MFVSDLWGAVGRRWYVVLLGLLAAAAMTFGVSKVVPVTYEAKALVVLLPPASQKDLGGNPFLGLNGLDSLAAVLGRSMSSDSLTAQVRAISPKATFTVGPDATTAGPVLLAIVEDPSSAAADAVLDRVLAEVPTRLRALQLENGAPPSTLVSQTLVTRDAEPVGQNKDLVRALIVVASAGLAGSIAAAALVDRLVGRRRRSLSIRPAKRGLTQRPHPRPRPRPVPGHDDEPDQDPTGLPPGISRPLVPDADTAPLPSADHEPGATASAGDSEPPDAPSLPDHNHHVHVEHAPSSR